MDILAGPTGSRLFDLQKITTDEAFLTGRLSDIEDIQREYLEHGAEIGVTATYGASPRGPHPSLYTPEMESRNEQAVAIAKRVFGERNVVGSVASLLRNGIDRMVWEGLHDWEKLSIIQHEGQLSTLRENGISTLLVEALPDFPEGIGLVQAASKQRMKKIVLSFEPPSKGVPENGRRMQTYEEVLSELQSHAEGGTEVVLGLNCASVERLVQLVAASKEKTFAFVYPNQCLIPEDRTGERFLYLAHLHERRDAAEQVEFAKLRSLHELEDKHIDALLRVCLDKGVETVGLCCGASPLHIANMKERLQILRNGTPSYSGRASAEHSVPGRRGRLVRQ